MPEEKPKGPINEVILRSYPKVIFFYPLLFTTLILWIIEAVSPGNSIAGAIWFIMFFANAFVQLRQIQDGGRHEDEPPGQGEGVWLG